MAFPYWWEIKSLHCSNIGLVAPNKPCRAAMKAKKVEIKKDKLVIKNFCALLILIYQGIV